MNHEAAAQQAASTTASGLTCNINGILPQERTRYGRLVETLRHAIAWLSNQTLNLCAIGQCFTWIMFGTICLGSPFSTPKNATTTS